MPFDAAARVAVDAAVESLQRMADDSPLELVRFVLFSEDVLAAFESAVRQMGQAPKSG